jgi:lipid-binding SYLF domain-containing protein
MSTSCSFAYNHLDGNVISKKDFEEAYGLVIFNSQGASVGAGGEVGSGLVMARHAKGDWSLPSAVSQTYVGGGPSFGVNVYSSVRVLKKEEFEKCFIKQIREYGMQFAAAAGPLGIKIEVEGQSMVQRATKSEGVYFGWTVGATHFKENKDLNAKFYGKEVAAREVLRGEIQVPEAGMNEVRSLWDFLTLLEK